MAEHLSKFTAAAYEPALTVSASYGAGGSVIAPRLAENLDLPFTDRLLTVDVTEEAARHEAAATERGETTGQHAALHSGEGLSGDEKAASPGNRLFTYLARAASVGTITAPFALIDTDDELRERAEASLAPIRAGEAGVVLGRAGAVLLASRPRTYHVRLDGPAARRIRAATAIDQIPDKRAAEILAQTDRSRELWVKRLYRADPTDPKWYHLWIDATVLSHDDVVEVVAGAFHRFVASSL